jgi:two-component system, response regulator YesN
MSQNLWYLGAQLMASVQGRDEQAAQLHLDAIVVIISRETVKRFSLYKLRIFQVLTNANRAAFSAGASVDELGVHSQEIVEQVDQLSSHDALSRLARSAVSHTIALVPGRNRYQERIVQESIDYIRTHLAENFSRDQLAALLQCSPSHLSRVFSRTTGYAYKDFLLKCRLEKAMDLLQHSHLRIAEIAGMVGYQDPFQFSKIFRKRIGISPRKFRESRGIDQPMMMSANRRRAG